MKRITVFEIALSAIILSLALTAKYFDHFIPHVHPFHVLVLSLGVALMRFRMAALLMIIYVALKFILFGIPEPTAFMVSMHVLQILSLFLISLIRLFNHMNKKKQAILQIIIIIITMAIYLSCMIVGDSDYSPKSIPFGERVRLALIWPGDWLNVLITTSIMIVVIPTTYFLFSGLIKEKLDRRFI